MTGDTDTRLAQIRALCDEREHGPGPGWIPVDEIRAVLDAAPVTAPPQGIDRDALLSTFADYGFAPGTDPHSWRCYHPDRYGPCDCAEQVAEAILALVRLTADGTQPCECTCHSGHRIPDPV